jgi:hypothetical protein
MLKVLVVSFRHVPQGVVGGSNHQNAGRRRSLSRPKCRCPNVERTPCPTKDNVVNLGEENNLMEWNGPIYMPLDSSSRISSILGWMKQWRVLVFLELGGRQQFQILQMFSFQRSNDHDKASLAIVRRLGYSQCEAPRRPEEPKCPSLIVALLALYLHLYLKMQMLEVAEGRQHFDSKWHVLLPNTIAKLITPLARVHFRNLVLEWGFSARVLQCNHGRMQCSFPA